MRFQNFSLVHQKMTMPTLVVKIVFWPHPLSSLSLVQNPGLLKLSREQLTETQQWTNCGLVAISFETAEKWDWAVAIADPSSVTAVFLPWKALSPGRSDHQGHGVQVWGLSQPGDRAWQLSLGQLHPLGIAVQHPPAGSSSTSCCPQGGLAPCEGQEGQALICYLRF